LQIERLIGDWGIEASGDQLEIRESSDLCDSVRRAQRDNRIVNRLIAQSPNRPITNCSLNLPIANRQ
jgi:hypothetical protein